jgi:hypothetical protein
MEVVMPVMIVMMTEIENIRLYECQWHGSLVFI